LAEHVLLVLHFPSCDRHFVHFPGTLGRDLCASCRYDILSLFPVGMGVQPSGHPHVPLAGLVRCEPSYPSLGSLFFYLPPVLFHRLVRTNLANPLLRCRLRARRPPGDHGAVLSPVTPLLSVPPPSPVFTRFPAQLELRGLFFSTFRGPLVGSRSSHTR